MLTRREKLKIRTVIRQIHTGKQQFSCNGIYYEGKGMHSLRVRYEEFIGSYWPWVPDDYCDSKAFNFPLIRTMLLLLFLEVEG